MRIETFIEKFEKMRQENLGRTFERREVELLALKYGLYVNSIMWTCGYGTLLNSGKIGRKNVYFFKNTPTIVQDVAALRARIHQYTHDKLRTIEHAKAILRRNGINIVD